MSNVLSEKREIKAILFDLGETLLNFGKVKISDVFRQGAKASYAFLQSCNQPVGNFKGYCWRNLLAIRSRNLRSAITGNDFDSLWLLKKIGTKAGYKLDESQWQHLAWLWYEPLSKLGRVEPDLIQTLGSLKKAGLKLAIVSNTFLNKSSLDRHLEQLGILDFFEFRFYSYEFEFRKPDLRIFKAAAEKIAEPMANIMFIGDRIDNDIKPALKTAMTAVLKAARANIGKKTPPGALKISNLSELPTLIEKIGKEGK